MSGANLWVTAGLAVMINGSSLLGAGQNSVGAIARCIESRHELNHAIERATSHKMLLTIAPQQSEQWPVETGGVFSIV
ncbi:hypothetical protein BZK31_23205 [Pseudomonas floridensis]|uniref:Uncharacterized protein n=1 Tax=Pseudomonas floridensis TaxID=1958950 RepID=A0A1X0N011_9PSED|nr:hypothetical protein [Pseudomonas floridensis]ORC56334.1 hypothetical protein BZK31_23205 [Pseudomonas floridensis]